MRYFLDGIKKSLILRRPRSGRLEGRTPSDPGKSIVSAYLYILRCADGSYYVGTTRGTLEGRLEEHQAGIFDGYTSLRRPLTLVFHQEFERIEDAVSAERQLKGWRREKKEALIRGEYSTLPSLARRS